MLKDSLDFEGIFEGAIAALIQSAGIAVFTSSQVPDFQNDRPRVELKYVHGPAHHALQTANQQALPSELKGQKIVVAWDSSLHLNIVTAADAQGKQDQIDIRTSVRLIFLNLASQLNGTLLTGHKINLVVENGSSRGLHPEQNTETLLITYSLSVSLHESVWSSYSRITSYGTERTGFTRILATGTATTELFRNIPDLNDSGTAISSSGVMELYQNGENVKVTVATLKTAIGGGIPIYDGNPNGNVVVTGPSLLLGSGNSQGNLWATTSGTTWFPLLSIPT